jgi:hypothetical protein
VFSMCLEGKEAPVRTRHRFGAWPTRGSTTPSFEQATRAGVNASWV